MGKEQQTVNQEVAPDFVALFDEINHDLTELMLPIQQRGTWPPEAPAIGDKNSEEE